jgi:hypothetical protein
MSEDTISKLIRQQVDIISSAKIEIDRIAKQKISDFHFLDHQVSYFWSHCKTSPIGYCVWDISKKGFNNHCRCYYCGEPVERK